jgi:serine/threonine protein kinase/Flp pilus assembly protein TadD
MTIRCSKCNHENPDDTVYCGKCGILLKSLEDISVTKTLETPVQGLSIGTTFAGRYQIIEELGKGGMGAVYKALDIQINEEVAIKLIRPDIASDEKTIERFSNELKLARKISHKNVCRMYHLEREGETPYISMEHLQGEDLKDLIQKKEKLTIEEAIGVAKQVCEGLAEAHRLGVVHRDLKPQNIMVDKEGIAKIMDFGIARSVEAPGVTATGVIIGTPDYISPEQAEGQEADHRSDIYSLGVILYEMVTGSVPFKGDTALSVALKHKSQLPLDPRKFNPAISDDLSRLILICMEKDKERRYQTAEALLDDLRNIEEGLPLGTKIRPRRATFIQTLIHKKLFLPALVVILAIIAVAIWQLLPQKEVPVAPKIENSIAVIGFENQTGDETFNHLEKLIPNLLINNLENSGFFYVATWEQMRDLLKQKDNGDVDIITSDLGFQACRMGGIGALALGSYAKVGETFVTNIQVLDVETKRLLKSASSRGEGEESFLDQIDELSKKISEGMGISSQTIETAKFDIREVTTPSVEAYNYFLKGREDFEKLYFEEAKQSIEKAVILDPEFAMAYLYLSRIHFYPYENQKASAEAIKKAQAFSQRATEKERLYIEATYAADIEHDLREGINILQELIEKYPQEAKRAHKKLGEYYNWAGNVDRALEEFHKSLAIDPDFGPTLSALGYLYSQMENYDKAVEYFEKYISAAPADANPLDSLAEAYYRMGRLDEAKTKFKEAQEVKPEWTHGIRVIPYIEALKEDYAEAMNWIDQLMAFPRERAGGQIFKGFYDLWLGRRDLSLEEIRTAKILRPDYPVANLMEALIYEEMGKEELARESLKTWLDYIRKNSPPTRHKLEENIQLGRYDLKEGRIDSAKARLAEMESLLPEADPSFSKMYYKPLLDSLHAEVLLAEGSLEEAAAVGKKVSYPRVNPKNGYIIASYNTYFSRDVLARIYIQKGELNKAIAEYERLMTFDPANKDWRLVHPKFHYRLAKLYEQKGLKTKAIDRYEKFLTLYKDADPGITEVEDARKRLADLQIP